MTEPATSWPVPDREVTVAGRTRSLELVLVAGLDAVAACWLAFELRDSVPFYFDVVREIVTGQGLGLFFGWIGLVVIALFWYLVLALGFVAVKVFQVDPLGRGLSPVVTALLAVALFTSEPPWPLWIILVLSALGTASLALSPSMRRDFTTASRRRERPDPVVVSETVAVSYYSLLGVLTVLLLPGLRYLGDLGASFVIYEALALAGCVTVWLGRGRLRSGERAGRRQGRLLLSLASALVLAGFLVAAHDSGAALAFVVFGTVVAPLWLASSARTYFGDAPLQTPSV